ncbi:glycyl-radical enzyme activating protein [Kalamiella sp. sgz302252]|uniref:glycyl-radical enzyme activating protein n=1 Tax=Pantoea sp. sgz302252 TaxID=3341827 RepID=UPI0036D41DC1
MKLSAVASCAHLAEVSGRVFNIQRFSLHDGPGVRTVVFLKGCQMRCVWCANPESLAPQPEVLFDRQRCAKMACWHSCPGKSAMKTDAISYASWPDDGDCPAAALRKVGKTLSVAEVMRAVAADEIYYRTSGGGMTLSGGEIAMQPEFSRALLHSARQEGIHTAVETSGFAAWPALWQACEASQLILYDLKLADDALHQRYTGVSNRSILQNLARLLEQNIPLRIRIPVIPEVNDSGEQGEKIIGLIADITRNSRCFQGIDLLPYHNFGLRKYTLSDRHYLYDEMHAGHGKPQVAVLEELAGRYGLATATLSHCIG